MDLEDRGLESFSSFSDHDKKKERKRFLKRLVQFHDRRKLTLKINGKCETGTKATKTTMHNIASTDQIGISQSTPLNEKVRFYIAEAIYKVTKSKKKDEQSVLKSSKGECTWKMGGTKKTLVLPRSTKVKELIDSCKNKLKMKKKAIRVFYVDPDSKLEIDLDDDLSGLNDGVILLAASHKEEKDEKEEGKDISDDIDFPDPLEAVKLTYLQKKGMRTKKKKLNSSSSKELQLKFATFPTFGTSLEALEPLSKERSELPAASCRDEFLRSLDCSRVCIVDGETGSGKSTQIPQYILEGMKAIGCENETNILVTQPRRVAATSLALRVSAERNSPKPGKEGSEVGYNIRLDRAVSDTCKITYCTVGVLLRMLVNPKEDLDGENEPSAVPLASVSHIVLDEIHIRDLNTDFALTLLRPLLSLNKRISIIVMSATVSTNEFVEYFQGCCPETKPRVIHISGRTYPVNNHWLESCEQMTSMRLQGWNSEVNRNKHEEELDLSPRAPVKIDYDFILQLIKEITKEEIFHGNETKTSGAIMVFLPGKFEIESLARNLYKDPFLGDNKKCTILHLHSSLTPSEQWKAFQSVKRGMLKIVLTTNVAETSITIPDISVVIDSGRVKESRFNPTTRIKELVTVWTSQASMKQRSGRAGRTGPGICYKLYTEEFALQSTPLQTSPEIVRTPLEEIILQVCLLDEQRSLVDRKGTSPFNFFSQAPTKPPDDSIEKACAHLLEMGAVNLISDQDEGRFRLTPLGYHLSHLPMDPKVGKILIVGSILRCIGPAMTIAATLSCSRSCWLPYFPGEQNSKEKARKVQASLIEDGFGGPTWNGGTIKGDLIAVVAAYNKWSSGKSDKERRGFARNYALDHNALVEMKGLRTQIKESLTLAGLIEDFQFSSSNDTDAHLTSCCLASGLYPNIAILLRPSQEIKYRGGRLMTKDGLICRPNSNSFQGDRVRNARESGKDAYCMFYSKHKNVNTVTPGKRKMQNESTISEVNFVSKFSILLFGGQIEVEKNFLVMDGWLKFKVGEKKSNESNEKSTDKCRFYSVLIHELRKELDFVLLKQIRFGEKNSTVKNDDCDRVINAVRILLNEQ